MLRQFQTLVERVLTVQREVYRIIANERSPRCATPETGMASTETLLHTRNTRPVFKALTGKHPTALMARLHTLWYGAGKNILQVRIISVSAVRT